MRNNKDFSAFGGGGIRILDSDNIRLESVVISDNESTKGGGIAIQSSDNTVIVDSQIIGNHVSEPDTPDSAGIPDGGGIRATSVSFLTLQNTVVSSNTAGFRGGGIAFLSSSDLLIDSSTISKNQASRGGGIYLGARFNTTTKSENVQIVNSTISRNVVKPFTFEFQFYGSYNAQGGGISAKYIDGVEIISSTINGNQALGANAQSGGLHTESTSSNISLTNSIIANSRGQDCADGATSVDTVSVIEDGSCGASRSGNPRILALTANGGPTFTHALAENSIARNSSVGTCTVTDQRGKKRDISDGACDVGAFEFIEGLDDVDDTSFFVVPLKSGKSVIFGL
ncbi:parallel beta helix pectate lyase-like protein [Arenicella xantha]|uniref:Parallel beta helix pectate lyase-like protein n=1 Tax=Arenicella xantha TaxID=644221 RepID=A0A395JFH6_9GAMM|nr:parallel beta helix pectate lyase-like protein [Arenicella xantha]